MQTALHIQIVFPALQSGCPVHKIRGPKRMAQFCTSQLYWNQPRAARSCSASCKTSDSFAEEYRSPKIIAVCMAHMMVAGNLEQALNGFNVS